MYFKNERDQFSHNPLFQKTAVGSSLKEMPLSFIDVGARGGVHDIVEPLASHVAVLGFEPNQAECERLLKMPAVTDGWADFQLEPVGLYAEHGEKTLYSLSSATNDSLRPPNTRVIDRYAMQEKWSVLENVIVSVESLDTVLKKKSNAFRWGEMIKLDTQGTEYEILEGAKQTLSTNTVAIMTEVAFCEIYQGQKLFSDIEQFLRTFGFTFYGFSAQHTRAKKYLDKHHYISRERLFYADAVFFKDPLAERTDISLDPRGYYALFSSALLLGYYDFAYELALSSWLQNPEHAGETEAVRDFITALAYLAPERNTEAVAALQSRVAQQPELANVYVGGFVDAKRAACDYNDVLHISALPKQY